MTKGLLQNTPPKLHPFSGEQLREDVPYEQWGYEVKKALQSHTEKSVYEAMVQCLKGHTLDGVRSLGENASVTDILNYLKGLSKVLLLLILYCRIFSNLNKRNLKGWPNLL